MVRQQIDHHCDDLLADSLQVEHYLRQGDHCQLYTVHLGNKEGIRSYFERYQLASPQLQFQIFLFSSLYARKMECFLTEKGGGLYA